MALITCGTGDWICPGADSRLTGVSLGARIAIITGSAIRFGWIGTQAGRWIAGPGIVTLITRRTSDWV